MRIGQIARLTGVSPKVIRTYDRMGLLVGVSRAANGYREFGEEAVIEILFIHELRRLGFTMAEIQELAERYHRNWNDGPPLLTLLDENIARIDGEIARLQELRTYIADFRQRHLDRLAPPDSTLFFLVEQFQASERARKAFFEAMAARRRSTAALERDRSARTRVQPSGDEAFPSADPDPQ